DDLRARLALYLVIPRDDWMHDFSHVGGSDEGGWLVSANRCYEYVVRPGGLAFVVYPDGTAGYLASCVSDHPRRPGVVPAGRDSDEADHVQAPLPDLDVA